MSSAFVRSVGRTSTAKNSGLALLLGFVSQATTGENERKERDRKKLLAKRKQEKEEKEHLTGHEEKESAQDGCNECYDDSDDDTEDADDDSDSDTSDEGDKAEDQKSRSPASISSSRRQPPNPVSRRQPPNPVSRMEPNNPVPRRQSSNPGAHVAYTEGYRPPMIPARQRTSSITSISVGKSETQEAKTQEAKTQEATTQEECTLCHQKPSVPAQSPAVRNTETSGHREFWAFTGGVYLGSIGMFVIGALVLLGVRKSRSLFN